MVNHMVRAGGRQDGTGRSKAFRHDARCRTMQRSFAAILLCCLPGILASACAGSSEGDLDAAEVLVLERCDPTRTVTPVSFDDVTYQEWGGVRCLERPCICDGTGNAPAVLVEALLSCDAVIGGYYWGMGSAVLQVMGRKDGNYLLRIAQEVEGGAVMHECDLPLPLSPWPGLATAGDTAMGDPSLMAGIEDHCTLVDQCSLFPEGPDPCDGSFPICNDILGGGQSSCG